MRNSSSPNNPFFRPSVPESARRVFKPSTKPGAASSSKSPAKAPAHLRTLGYAFSLRRTLIFALALLPILGLTTAVGLRRNADIGPGGTRRAPAAPLHPGSRVPAGREESASAPASQEENAIAAKNPGEVVVSADAQELAGIQSSPLESSARREAVQAYGTVIVMDKLAALRSRYAKDQADVETAAARLRYAKENYDRLHLLYAEGRNTSETEVEAAEAAWRAATAASFAARHVISAEEGSILQEWGPVVSGWLRQNSPAFGRLMRQEALLIRIAVSPRRSVPSAPAAAVIETPSAESVEASLVSPAPATDPRIQGPAFFYAARPAPGLKPGMNISAYLPVGPKEEGVVIPASAVVWWQGLPWVFVQTAPDRFARRQVQSYTPVEGGWFVRRGFRAGERIAVAGAQMLLSKEFESLIKGGQG